MVRAVTAELRRHGITDFAFEVTRGGHVRLSATVGDISVRQIMLASASDWRSQRNAVAILRRLLRPGVH